MHGLYAVSTLLKRLLPGFDLSLSHAQVKGEIDVLVNNAGMAATGSILEGMLLLKSLLLGWDETSVALLRAPYRNVRTDFRSIDS